MLREIATDLWVAEQPFRYWGVDVGTRMTIIRLQSGELVVISPIQMESLAAIHELGPVRYVIAPNLYHHLYIAEFQRRCPEAELLVVPDLAAKRSDLKIDACLDKAGHLQDQVSYLPFRGFRILDFSGPKLLNEVVFFHPSSQTLILTDTAFHFDATFSQATQLAARIMGAYRKLQPSWLEKVATRDRQAVKQAIEQVLTWDFERVIMAHGTIVEHNAKARLQAGYEWFLSQPLKSSVGEQVFS
ncbi:MAG: DUF4336 domain-containing protein [Thermosynechococcaceae cyanobacterium]